MVLFFLKYPDFRVSAFWLKIAYSGPIFYVLSIYGLNIKTEY